MAKSLFNISAQTPNQQPASRNVLAQPDATGKSALQVAIAAALAALGQGSTFLNAMEQGGKDIDFSYVADLPGPAKAVYSVQFRPGSGPNGTNPTPVLVYVNPQATVTTFDAAISTAASSVGAMPSTAVLVGNVDIDATVSTPTPVTLTKFQFRSLFTFAELVAVDNFAANANLTADQKATLTTIMANFAAAEDITLSDPATQQGVDYLATSGLITTERAAAILANQPAPTS